MAVVRAPNLLRNGLPFVDLNRGRAILVGMTDFFSCFSCNKVSPQFDGKTPTCPLCGSANGEVLPPERVKPGLDAGVFMNPKPKGTRRRPD